MKFTLRKRSVFEISGIKQVMVNKVKVINGKKVKVGKTYVWELTQTKKGLRWFKYDHALIEEMKKNCATPEEFREFADKAIMDGYAPDKMHHAIQKAMREKGKRVWFSGSTCNIELDVTNVVKDVMMVSVRNVMEYIHAVTKQLDDMEREINA